MGFWDVVASAGPYASLHLAPDRQPCQYPTTLFLQAGCPSCRPTNSVKALKKICTPQVGDTTAAMTDNELKYSFLYYSHRYMYYTAVVQILNVVASDMENNASNHVNGCSAQTVLIQIILPYFRESF